MSGIAVLLTSLSSIYDSRQTVASNRANVMALASSLIAMAKVAVPKAVVDLDLTCGHRTVVGALFVQSGSRQVTGPRALRSNLPLTSCRLVLYIMKGTGNWCQASNACHGSSFKAYRYFRRAVHSVGRVSQQPQFVRNVLINKKSLENILATQEGTTDAPYVL